jgi:beta-glucosidase-like glycosyl hydrolase/CubicO group peptidase (beta-lactamase class C family)
MPRCAIALLLAVSGLTPRSVPAQELHPRAKELLATLSNEAKAAQLMMGWSLTRLDDGYPRRDELREWVETVGIGGVILSVGAVADAPRLVADLSARAKVPLLFAGDFETGVAFRLRGATEFGPAMLLGAANSSELVRRAAAATAREARALGFQWIFGPVLDVNVNPANPVIHVRSFGEDPQRVAALGLAYIEGMREERVFATGKHFPGHGDTAIDSHLAMPTVPGDRARLDAVELLPFRAAIAGGLDTIMTGHLSVPGLGEEPGVVATLSKRILTDLLREQLGFRGVIVTDALEMKGLPSDSREDLALRALRAGADLLLMPIDPRASARAIAAAIDAGTLDPARLDAACSRILDLKARAGLLDADSPPSTDLAAIGTAASTELARECAERGLTILRDPHGDLPLSADEVTLVEFVEGRIDEAGGSFRTLLSDSYERFSALRLEADVSDAQATAAVEMLTSARARGAVAVLGLRTRKPSLPAPLAKVVEALGERAVTVIFGNPYLAAKLPPNAAVVLAYGTSEATASAAARLLRGDGPASGRLPVTLPDIGKRGAGLSLLPADAELTDVAPTAEGFAADLADRLRARLLQGIDDKVAPGAVALVARRGRVVAEVAVGRETWAPDSRPIRASSRFDLASLTKVCATTPAALRLLDQGKLALDRPIVEWLPSFTGEGKDRVTLRHLLTHSSGLPAYIRFFLDTSGKAQILDRVYTTPLTKEPGTATAYSDLGLILTMALIEKASGRDFADYVATDVFAPLGMTGAGFSRSGSPIDAVPTEDCPWRKRVVRGEVHDENAFAMGGVSGHAGLFGTARDVARVGIAYLSGGRGVLRPATARLATQRQAVVAGSTRALGWDTFVPGGPGGTKLSPGSFGHTGFTGTSIQCDPARDLVIVLLTNRVHPSRENSRIFPLRGAIADLVIEALVDE